MTRTYLGEKGKIKKKGKRKRKARRKPGSFPAPVMSCIKVVYILYILYHPCMTNTTNLSKIPKSPTFHLPLQKLPREGDRRGCPPSISFLYYTLGAFCVPTCVTASAPSTTSEAGGPSLSEPNTDPGDGDDIDTHAAAA